MWAIAALARISGMSTNVRAPVETTLDFSGYESQLFILKYPQNAQKVVSIIKRDKDKTQIYCQSRAWQACPPKCQSSVSLCCFQTPQGRVELVNRPINFVAGNHKRGTDPDGVVMGVLT
jgi:hypothetical protein